MNRLGIGVILYGVNGVRGFPDPLRLRVEELERERSLSSVSSTVLSRSASGSDDSGDSGVATMFFRLLLTPVPSQNAPDTATLALLCTTASFTSGVARLSIDSRRSSCTHFFRASSTQKKAMEKSTAATLNATRVGKLKARKWSGGGHSSHSSGS